MLLFSHLVGTETLDIGVNKSQTPPEAILPSQQHDTTVLLQAELLNTTLNQDQKQYVYLPYKQMIVNSIRLFTHTWLWLNRSIDLYKQKHFAIVLGRSSLL